jgi:ABC-type branched-subunit amino acid transport system ATPase component
MQHGAEPNAKIVQDILKEVHGKGQGTGPKDEVGQVLYMRGLIARCWRRRRARAQERFGKGKVMTGEQVRWGLENLALDQKKLDALGFAGVMRPCPPLRRPHGLVLGAHAHLGRRQVDLQLRLVPGRRFDHQAAGQGLGREVRGREEADSAVRRRTARADPPPAERAPGPSRGPPADRGAGRSSVRCLPRNSEGPPMSNILLNVNGIEVIYNHVILVLKGVSLQVPEGGVVALLGGNGAGKTTTLRAVSNLLAGERGEVTKGSIELRGERIEKLSTSDMVERGVIQVMEGRHCFAHLTIEENLLTGAYTRKDGKAAIDRQTLEKVYNYFPRLKTRRTSQAAYTSGGEQQMCAIGRALMANPKMVLLDDPAWAWRRRSSKRCSRS